MFEEPVVEKTIAPVEVIAEEEEEAGPMQLSLFDTAQPEISAAEKEVLDAVAKLNVMGTTPIQAMTMLYELQQKLLSNK